MIDLGTVAHPAFADINADGLTDLVIGNYGYYTPGVPVNARLYLFLNTGSPTAPKFELSSTDWMGLSEFTTGDYDFSPTFGDLDSDGDLDLLVGNNIGGFYYYKNMAGPDQPMNLQRDQSAIWGQIDVVGSVSTPVLYDLDQDGLLDIVAGERTGYVNFFRNKGTASTPLFSAVPEIGRVGQVDARTPFDAAGYCAPTIIQTTDGPLLLIGTQGGHLEAYFISQNLQDTFFLTDARWGGLDVGNRSHPALADLDSDGILEMALGNARGGLTIYKTVLKDCSVSATEPSPSGSELKISPNPVQQWARIEWQGHSDASWRAFNALGQLTAEGKLDGSTGYLDVKTWPSGAYFIEAVSGRERQSGRLIKR